MQTLKIKTNKVYEELESSYLKENIAIFEGGSRAGKSYNILIWIILKCLTTWDNKVIDIGRKTLPSCKVSIMHDFLLILNNSNLYNSDNHNKSENTYVIGSNLIRFFGIDSEQKKRGAGRDILFINEANELSIDEFRQLNQRTRELTILDYNPSDEFSWCYDIQADNKVKVFKSTFLDNPFISSREKQVILSYKEADENYWRIYGLGLRGISGATIFTHWSFAEEFKAEGEVFYGLDFGFNHPTALLRTYLVGNTIITEELLYKTSLTSDDLIRELNDLEAKGLLKKTDKIIADSSRPELIEQIYRAGFNIFPTKKGKDSVINGINFIKKNRFLITKESHNLIKEVKAYKWKMDKNGVKLDEPVKLNDDLMDSLRYSLEEASEERSTPIFSSL
jgi:phage terminase large subunit